MTKTFSGQLADIRLPIFDVPPQPEKPVRSPEETARLKGRIRQLLAEQDAVLVAHYYTDGDLHRLRFIRLCRAMDMSLDAVRTLLALDGARKADCVAANTTLDAHLGHVRERLAELQARLGRL